MRIRKNQTRQTTPFQLLFFQPARRVEAQRCGAHRSRRSGHADHWSTRRWQEGYETIFRRNDFLTLSRTISVTSRSFTFDRPTDERSERLFALARRVRRRTRYSKQRVSAQTECVPTTAHYRSTAQRRSKMPVVVPSPPDWLEPLIFPVGQPLSCTDASGVIHNAGFSKLS